MKHKNKTKKKSDQIN